MKLAATDEGADWLRNERIVYRSLSGAPFLPRLIGWHDDGERPALAIEDLSGAEWPPPWTPARIDTVRESLAQVARTPPPAALPSASQSQFDLNGWPEIATDPGPFLGLGMCSAAWLERALPVLDEAAKSADLGGDSLLHMDVRSDNLCVSGDRAILIDWNWACRGNAAFDLAAWLPSLHAEGDRRPRRSCRRGEPSPRCSPATSALTRPALPFRSRRTCDPCSSPRRGPRCRGPLAPTGSRRRLQARVDTSRGSSTQSPWLLQVQAPATLARVSAAPSTMPANEVMELLRSRGLRMTPQRRAIVFEVMRTQGHIAPADVARKVQGEMPGVNASTVYRTLALLEEIGVLSHAHLESGAEYHRTEEAGHVHLTCSSCGAEDDLSIDEAQALQKVVERHHGFEPDLTHFAISGLCAACQRTRVRR